MHYERLTATDATFLRIETAHEPQHVGSLSLLEGAPLRDDTGRIRLDELRRHVGRRIHRVPRLRQKVMEVPYGQGRPVWVDDAEFDLDYHVRLTSLPRPGDDEQLTTLMSRLQSQPLDRSRPLWEMWFVDGIVDDAVGLVLKVHHSLGDGIANVDLALALLDLERDPGPDPDPPAWRARTGPTEQRLLADAIRSQLTQPWRMGRSVMRSARDPLPAIESVVNVARTLANFVARPDPAPWNQAVSAHRRWVHADVPLDLVRRVRERHTATINDVVLTACTGALREFMSEHDHATDGVLKAMVPVSRRTESERGDSLGNKVSMIVVDLPVHEPDPVRRLERVRADTGDLKGSGYVDGAEAIIKIADGITPVAVPLTRFFSRSIPMNLVITNIPGPPVPLYLAGARLERAYPYVEVIDNEGLTIAVLSYDDQLFFGITADRDVMRDLDRVAEAIEKEFVTLADAG